MVLVTVAAFAAVGPAGGALSQQFNIPGREGFETNKELAAIYGSGGDVAPIVPVVQLPPGTTVDSPGVRDELGTAIAKVAATLPDAMTASFASTAIGVRLRRRPHHLWACLHPGERRRGPWPGGGPRGAGALAGVTVGGAPVEVTGLDALRASAGENEGSGTGVLLGTLLAALGALLVLAFVFRSFMAFVPLLMALVAIPTTFLLVWPLASVTDVSVIVQFLVALVGLGIAIDYALLIVVRWREERQQPGVTNEDAVRKAMQHAGAAVVFSGTTVAISLLALLVLPVPFMRSIGIAGLMIALVSVAVAITLLPVVLATIGPRFDWPRNSRRKREPGGPPGRDWSYGTAGPQRWRRRLYSSHWSRSRLRYSRNRRADSLAQDGPARVGLVKLEDSGIGTGPLSPFDALVRSGNAGEVAAALGEVEGVRSAAAPVQWRRDGTAIVVAIPTADGNSRRAGTRSSVFGSQRRRCRPA